MFFWVRVFFYLLMAGAMQASVGVSSDDLQVQKSIRLALAYRELAILRNDLVRSMQSDEFVKLKTIGKQAAYLDNLRRNTVYKYQRDPLFRVCGRLHYTGEYRRDPFARLVHKYALLDLLWVKNSIYLQQKDCYRYLAQTVSSKELQNIKNQVPLLKIERFRIAHCLGEADSSDEEYLLDT